MIKWWVTYCVDAIDSLYIRIIREFGSTPNVGLTPVFKIVAQTTMVYIQQNLIFAAS